MNELANVVKLRIGAIYEQRNIKYNNNVNDRKEKDINLNFNIHLTISENVYKPINDYILKYKSEHKL
jgi:hypothetical protein